MLLTKTPSVPRYAFAALTIFFTSCGGSECVSGPLCTEPGGTGSGTSTPTSITTSVTTLAFAALGTTQSVSATVRDQNNNEMTGQALAWSTSNSSVATVSATGVVTSVGNGTANVSVASGSAQASVAVTVLQVAAAATISPDPVTIDGAGNTVGLTASVVDGAGATIASPTLVWSTSDPDVVTVNSGGIATALGGGVATISVQASLLGGAAVSASVGVTVTVSATLVITTSTLPFGETSAPYDEVVVASGGDGSYAFALTAGSLPSGLTIGSSDGSITGTPTVVGLSVFTVEVTSGDGQTASRQLEIEVLAPFTFFTTTLPSGRVGSSYAASLETSGGGGTVSWTITAGALPVGISLDGATGALSGTPSTAETATFTIEARDVFDQVSLREFSIEILGLLDILTSSLSAGITGIPYDEPLGLTGGDGANSWTVTVGTLPDGLTLDVSTGSISGTPSTAESQSFTVQVASGDGQIDTQALAIEIFDPLAIETTSLPNGSIGFPYDPTVQISGGDGLTTWSLTAGTLPDGLTLNSTTGTISGTPTTLGSSTFTITVTDDHGQTDSREYMVTINTPTSSAWACGPGVSCQDVFEVTLTAGSEVTITTSSITGNSVARLALFSPGTALSGTNLLTASAFDQSCGGMNITESATLTVYETGTYRLAVGRDWGSSAGASGTYGLLVTEDQISVTPVQTIDDLASEAQGFLCPSPPLVACTPSGSTGDGSPRGFYVGSYPGSTLDVVELFIAQSSGGDPMSMTLTARTGTYDGAVLGVAGLSFAPVSSGSGEATPAFFDFGSVAVTPGETVTFALAVTSGGAALYDVGIGGGSCAVTQTHGTTPPLDTFRRSEIGINIFGN